MKKIRFTEFIKVKKNGSNYQNMTKIFSMSLSLKKSKIVIEWQTSNFE